jgi:uncharacterized protein (DUF433 family)
VAITFSGCACRKEAEEIVASYPSLRVENVRAANAYVAEPARA